jgi:hypothetical protein
VALVDGLAPVQVRHLDAQLVDLVRQRAGEAEQERDKLLVIHQRADIAHPCWPVQDRVPCPDEAVQDKRCELGGHASARGQVRHRLHDMEDA